MNNIEPIPCLYWIHVEYALPDLDTDVLVYSDRGYRRVAHLFNEGCCENDPCLVWATDSENLIDITHWMPVPKKPHE